MFTRTWYILWRDAWWYTIYTYLYYTLVCIIMISALVKRFLSVVLYWIIINTFFPKSLNTYLSISSKSLARTDHRLFVGSRSNVQAGGYNDSIVGIRLICSRVDSVYLAVSDGEWWVRTRRRRVLFRDVTVIIVCVLYSQLADYCYSVIMRNQVNFTIATYKVKSCRVFWFSDVSFGRQQTRGSPRIQIPKPFGHNTHCNEFRVLAVSSPRIASPCHNQMLTFTNSLSSYIYI